MLDHEKLMESWRIDSTLDPTRLAHTMSSHPLLHSKYLTYLQNYKVSLRKHVMKYQKMKVLKQSYYNGEMTKEALDEHGWKQFLFKRPLKSEMEALLDGDADLQLIQEQSLYLEGLVSACESILKDTNSRYFLFRAMVDYEKFQAGV